jgi:hypothetical protein
LVGAGAGGDARGLGVPQKPLYRRLDRTLRDLRGLLVQAGMSREQARTVLAEWAP